MIFEFYISDADKTPISEATLTVQIARASGRGVVERKVGPTDKNGYARDEIADKMIEKLDFSKISYVISHKSGQFQASPRGPAAREDQQVRIELKVAEFRSDPQDDDGPNPVRQQIKLIHALRSKGGEPLANQKVQMLLEGKPVETYETDNKGYITLTVREDRIEKFLSTPFVFQVTGKDTVFTSTDRTKPEEVDGGFIVFWTMAPTGKTEGPEGGETKPTTPPRPKQRRVHGRCVDAKNAAVAGRTLRAVHREIGKDIPLGSDTTDKTGKYNILYDIEALPKGRNAPDLIVELLDDEGGVEARSDITENAPAVVEIDFATGAGTWTPPTLFDTLTLALADHIGDLSPADLTHADAELIAKRSGLEREEVATYLDAWRIAAEIDAGKKTREDTAMAGFAWIMKGLPAKREGLTQQTDTVLLQTLKKAVKAAVIRAVNGKAILLRLRANTSSMSEGDQSVIERLLVLAGASKTFAPQIGEVLAADVKGADLKDKINGIVGETKAEILFEVVGVWLLLLKDIDQTEWQVRENGALQPQDLAGRTEAQLYNDIDQVGYVPEDTKGKSEHARYLAYAELLAERIEGRFPYQFYLSGLAASEVESARETVEKLRRDPATRFDRAAPASGEDTVIADARSIYLVGPAKRRAATAEVLLDHEIERSGTIVEMGRTGFRKQFATPLKGPSHANDVFDRAKALENARAADLVAVLVKGDTDVVPTTLRGQLFNGGVQTGCVHCASLLSPGAYLVDLYAYASLAENKSGAAVGRAKLQGRRPDLEQTDVACANGETMLPYIDLVNELLEDRLAPNAAVTRQTTWEAEALQVWPEHSNAAAHADIGAKTFPWRLPFDRDAAACRAFFDAADHGFDELLWINGAAKDSLPVLLARLGISKASTLALPENEAKVAHAYGLAKFSALEDITSTLGGFTKHLQMAPDVLLELLSSDFLGLKAVPPVSESGAVTTELFDVALLARLQLMGRLMVVLKSTVAEVDILLSAIGAPDHGVDLNWIRRLDIALRLEQRFGIAADVLAALTELNTPEGQRALAAEMGLPEAQVIWVADSLGASPTEPEGIFAILQAQEGLGDTGFGIEDAQALLQTPTADGRFGPVASAAILSEIENAYGEAGTQEPLATALAQAGPDEDPLAEVRQAIAELTAAAMEVPVELCLRWLGMNNDVVLRSLIGVRIRLDALWLARSWKLLEFSALTGMDFVDAGHVSDIADQAGITDVLRLPVDAAESEAPLGPFLRLLGYWTVVAPHDQFFEMITNVGTVANLRDGLLESTDWPEARLVNALGPDGFAVNDLSVFMRDTGVLRLAALMAMAERFDAQPSDILNVARTALGTAARDLAAGAFAVNDWPKRAQEAMEPVREATRDALLGRVIHKFKAYGTAVDVSNDLLIDVEMAACFSTARIKEATGALQRFVQRINLELEGNLFFTEEVAREWAWRKSYRVWEANRKVFLYPENWLLPELRDNKTALYRNLEATLMKGDVRTETAEQALMEFARGLHEISGLEPMGLLEDNDEGITHVFARTREVPHIYYHCRRATNGLWSGWDEIEVDIEGNHFLPVIYNGRIFLFWANIEEKVNDSDPSYINTLATLEAELEERTSKLNNTMRSLDDAESKLDEYNTKVEQGDDHFNVYSTLAALYIGIIETLNRNLLTIQSEITSKKSAISQLVLDYSYLDVGLSWSQQRRPTGWSPVRRSSSSVPTKTSVSGDLQHWRYPDGMFLRRYVEGDRLLIEVQSYRRATDTTGGTYDEEIYRYGTFAFDVINDALITTVFASNLSWYREPTLAPYMTRQAQSYHTSIRDEFKVMASTNSHALLLSSPFSSGFGHMRVVPATRGLDLLGSAGMILELDRRTYLVEPTEQLALPRMSANVPSLATMGGGQMVSAQLTASIGKGPLIATGGATIVDATQSGDWESIPTPTSQSAPASLDTETKWRFSDLHHPYSDLAITALFRDGVQGLYAPDWQSGDQTAVWLNRQGRKQDDFQTAFIPNSDSVALPYPVQDFTFDRRDMFAIYNWELFYHAPLTVAQHLSQNRRFEEAQTWFHFIFNPTEKDGPRNASVWKFGPFRDVHWLLQDGDYEALLELDATALDTQIDEWLANPFNPHAVARLRSLAYMRATFMAYLDNLIAWADDLFARDTRESLSEATQLYVFAGQLLGQRPAVLPALAPKSVYSVADMIDGNVPEPGTKVRLMPANATRDTPATALFQRFGNLCLPGNDKLAGYWDRLENQLFKLRHCMNIDGVVRQLPLYQPPIDPALLVRAAAAGVSIADAVSGMSAKPPAYRFSYMINKAHEFTADVKALGGALLSALEKQDAELIAQLRADHEEMMSQRMLDVRKDRVKEAEELFAAATESKMSAFNRKAQFSELLAQGLLAPEKEREAQLGKSEDFSQAAQVMSSVAGALAIIPQFGTTGINPTILYGGLTLSMGSTALAQGFTYFASKHANRAGQLERSASNIRREQDWRNQESMARRDLAAAEKNEIAAEIRLEISRKELEDQQATLAYSEENADFLTSKFTNADLYSWMSGELSRLHYQAYALAVDLARQAEACFRFERDRPDASYIQFGHFDSQRKGLLAGERLGLELRQLEAAYLADNTRDNEMRTSVSLARLNAGELLKLRAGAEAAFVLPEFLFDLDAPGQYNRRIKSVSLTIPALVGPQTNVPCELRLESSMVRAVDDIDAALTPSIGGRKIIASGAQDDSGLFQVDFRDERYLPFEGAGAISKWVLRLPDQDIAQFDYATISDAVLTVAYTARSGDDSLRRDAMDKVRDEIGAVVDGFGDTVTPALLTSLRYDHPLAWAAVRAEGIAAVTLELGAERFPYLFAGRRITLGEVAFYDQTGATLGTSNLNGTAPGLIEVNLPSQVGTAISNGDGADVWMVVNYGVS